MSIWKCKVEVYCDHNAIKNNKKVSIGSTQDVLKEDFIILNVVSLMRHIRIVPIYWNIFGRSRQS